MPTPQRASGAVAYFVPGYLLVVGLALMIWAVWLFVNLPDEQFVALMAALGGLTMWAAVAALLTVGRTG